MVAEWKACMHCLPCFLDNIEHFFLKQVASIYKDPSIGNLINIVIVKLVVIHNEQVMEVAFFSFCLTMAFAAGLVMSD